MGGGVEVIVDFDDMSLGLVVPARITPKALVTDEVVHRLALVLPDGIESTPGTFANDDLVKRQTFVGPFFTSGRDNFGYSGEAQEVDPMSGSGPANQASAWFRFIPITTANHDISTSYITTDMDSTLAIYQDSDNMATVMANLIAADDDSGIGFTSYLSNVALTAGVPYAIRVDGYAGEEGNYALGAFLS